MGLSPLQPVFGGKLACHLNFDMINFQTRRRLLR